MTEEDKNQATDRRPDGVARDDDGERIVSFAELSDGATRVLIEYEGQTYHLRATRNGRLVLNK